MRNSFHLGLERKQRRVCHLQHPAGKHRVGRDDPAYTRNMRVLIGKHLQQPRRHQGKWRQVI